MLKYVSCALGLGMSLLGLSASLGLSPDLLQSLGVGGNGQNICEHLG